MDGDNILFQDVAAETRKVLLRKGQRIQHQGGNLVKNHSGSELRVPEPTWMGSDSRSHRPGFFMAPEKTLKVTATILTSYLLEDQFNDNK